jgi:hypothetical protein
MRFFTLIALLLLVENQFLVAAIVVLLLQFSNSVFGHLGFDILAFTLASVAVIF